VATYTIAEMAGALGDPTRRSIFERLADGPRAVGQLASEFPISRPAVSQHLKILRDAGLVTDRAVGARRLYQVDLTGVTAMRAYFDSFWTRALANFAALAEQPQIVELRPAGSNEHQSDNSQPHDKEKP
jgi:DNA-binding transcriptional ArsR family regulator